jgi:phage-related protein
MSAAVEEALSQAREIDSDFREFFDTVNSVMDWVPGFLEHLIQPIIDGLGWLGDKIKEFWDSIADVLDNTGSPSKLEAHAEILSGTIMPALHDISDKISPSKLPSNIEWSGSGATAYFGVVGEQKASAETARDLAGELSNTLKELANGIEDFWIAMGIAFAALIVGTVAAIVEACTVVGIPPAIVTIIAAIGIALGAITAAIVALKAIFDTIDTSQDKIDQGLVKLGEDWAMATPEAQAKIDNPGEWKPS